MTLLGDARRYAPATERNREPILEVLLRVLPSSGNILELASGTGEHAAFFAPRLNPRHWIPSDPNLLLRESIDAWRKHSPADNLHPPLDINVQDSIWAIATEDIPIAAMVNINMIHIAPWSACLGLMAGASRLLTTGGILYLYGPYKQGGQHTAPSNFTFDESLRAQDPEWGVRNLEDVVTAANHQGLTLLEVIQMPANNLSVVFQRQE